MDDDNDTIPHAEAMAMMDEHWAEELSNSIDTCLAGLEDYIIDCAKRIDVGDMNCLNMASVASALHVLKLYEDDSDEYLVGTPDA